MYSRLEDKTDEEWIQAKPPKNYSMASEHTKRFHRGGKASVLGGILIHLTLGIIYSFGNVMTYMASYLRFHVDPNITYSSVVWVLSLSIMTQGGCMAVAGPLGRRIGARLTCTIGCIIMSAGVALTYFAVQHSLAAVVFTYGILLGLGIAIAYTTPLACAMKWYPRSKGVCNGLIVGGFGLSALWTTTFQTYYVNPGNISVASSGYFEDEGLLSRVPGLFLAMAGVFAAMQLLGCFLLGTPQQDETLQDDRWNHLLEGKEDEDGHNELSEVSLTPKQALKTVLFYHIWAIYLLNSITISFINSTYKSFGQTFVKNDYLLSLVGALAAVFNAGGRLFWGKMMDKTSFKGSMFCVTLLLCMLFIALSVAPTFTSPTVAYTAAIWLIFGTFSGTYVLMPTVTEKAFGLEHYTTIYGLMFTCQVVAGPLVAVLHQGLLGMIGYTGCFLVVAGVAACSCLATCFIPARL